MSKFEVFFNEEKLKELMQNIIRLNKSFKICIKCDGIGLLVTDLVNPKVNYNDLKNILIVYFNNNCNICLIENNETIYDINFTKVEYKDCVGVFGTTIVHFSYDIKQYPHNFMISYGYGYDYTKILAKINSKYLSDDGRYLNINFIAVIIDNMYFGIK